MTLPRYDAFAVDGGIAHYEEKLEGKMCRWIDVAPLLARIEELKSEIVTYEKLTVAYQKQVSETVSERDRMKEHLDYYSGQELLHGTHKDLIEKCDKLKEELALLNKAYVHHMQKIDEELAEAKELLDYCQYRVGPEMKKEIEVFLSIHAPAKEREQ